MMVLPFIALYAVEELKVSVSEVVRALREAGFKIDKQDSKSLQYQYLIKASKP